MIQHLLFQIELRDVTKARTFLQPLSVHPLYELKEKTKVYLGGFFKAVPDSLPDYLSNFTLQDNQVDWMSQWEEFCPHFEDKVFKLELLPYGIHQTLNLLPGPGFGDLSHATTQLCLKHMAKKCATRIVIDYGCGSGVLSVAAWAFGAYKVLSIEIEQEAIAHTKQNLRNNQFPDDYVFDSLPKLLDENDSLCVINMTFGEQKVALKDHELFKKPLHILSSGILKSQQNDYMKWAKSFNCEVHPIDELDGWVIFEGYLK